MRTLAVPAFLAGLLLAAGCLRSGPSLGGKLCSPGSGDCGGGLACVKQNAVGTSLSLPAPGGICEVSPLDCDPHTFDCPGDGGFWICSRQSGAPTCYAQSDESLAGSLCMVDRGICRTYGVFEFTPEDGGKCVTPPGNPHSLATGECWDAGGGAGLFCGCNGQDEDCDGVIDDFDPQVVDRGLAPALSVPAGSCAVGETYYLEPSGSPAPLTDGGPSVDSCATLSLTHAYALSRVEAYTTAAVTAGTCGAASAGTAKALVLFGALDGGLSMLGTAQVSSHTAAFAISGNYRTLMLCLSADAGAPFGISGVGLSRGLGAAGQCDLP